MGHFTSGEKVKFALVVVNMPLDGMVDKFKTLWDAGKWIVILLPQMKLPVKV